MHIVLLVDPSLCSSISAPDSVLVIDYVLIIVDIFFLQCCDL